MKHKINDVPSGYYIKCSILAVYRKHLDDENRSVVEVRLKADNAGYPALLFLSFKEPRSQQHGWIILNDLFHLGFNITDSKFVNTDGSVKFDSCLDAVESKVRSISTLDVIVRNHHDGVSYVTLY